MRMRRLLGVVLAVAGGLFIAPAGAQLISPAAAQPLEKFAFGTNWVAQAEHGGFYQALADGTYRRHGLDVTIVQGGPNINNRLLLPVGRIDGFMSANSLQSFDAVENNISDAGGRGHVSEGAAGHHGRIPIRASRNSRTSNG